jgi:hypothetical protein
VCAQRCRARSGSEASPSFRRLVGVFTARSTSRGFHASTGTRLIEDRDGRGLTEEIIEENLVRFLLSRVGLWVSFSLRSLFVFVLAQSLFKTRALQTHKLSLSVSSSSSSSFANEKTQDRKRGEAMKQNDAYVESALLTTRKEALSLYRSVIRASVLFVWRDTKGRVWKDVIRESARKEFEQGKHERDPEIVNRLILSGREAVDVALDKFMEQRQKIMDEESKGVPGAGFKS